MNDKFAFAAAAAVALLASHPNSPVLAASYIACGHGYHHDARGHCQSNRPVPDRFCPAGTQYHPKSGGYKCVPSPKGY